MNWTAQQLNLIDYRLIHPTTPEYTFFSSSHGTIKMTDHILDHKTHLNKFKRIEIIQNVLSDHIEIKLEIYNRKIAGQIPKYLEIKQRISK